MLELEYLTNSLVLDVDVNSNFIDISLLVEDRKTIVRFPNMSRCVWESIDKSSLNEANDWGLLSKVYKSKDSYHVIGDFGTLNISSDSPIVL